MKYVVVLPTYNEKENLKRLLPKLLAHKHLHVLVVDDNSPDATAEVAKKSRSPRVHLLSGEKKGLGVAYSRGIQYALNELEADVVIEMDADHSHDPQDLPRLLEALEQGADFVIGSRYVKGGRIEGWGAVRHAVSWGGNLVARVIGGFTQVRDTTAGFRAIKRWVLEGVNWQRLSTRGYGFQIRLLYEAKRQGARIQEIPVVFRDREVGASKLGLRDITEFFFTAVKLGWWTYGRLAKFLIVGATGFLVNWGLFSALYTWVAGAEWVFIALAAEASILWNFYWHNRWTFKDRTTNTFGKRFARYHYTSLGGVTLTYVTYYVLTLVAGLGALLAYPVSLAAATVWNFTLSYYWAWKR